MRRCVTNFYLSTCFAQGVGATDIARQLGIALSTVYKVLNETNEWLEERTRFTNHLAGTIEISLLL
ncbi:TPA: helix-turn-helix domain-containing protein [Vibrio campbellii]